MSKLTTEEDIKNLRDIQSYICKRYCDRDSPCGKDCDEYDSLENGIQALEQSDKIEEVLSELEMERDACEQSWNMFDDEQDFGSICAYDHAIDLIRNKLVVSE